MTIRPTSTGPAGRADAARVDAARAGTVPARSDSAARTAPRRPAEARADEVRISDQARDLQMQAAPESIPQGEVAPERLRSIAQRLEQGHYESPEVIDEVLRRVSRDL